MEAPQGYVCMDRSDIIRRCDMCIGRIAKKRAKKDKQFISDYTSRHNKWSWLPWWNPMDSKQIVKEIENMDALRRMSIDFPSNYAYSDLGDADRLLCAAKATKHDAMWIASGSCILNEVFNESK